MRSVVGESPPQKYCKEEFEEEAGIDYLQASLTSDAFLRACWVKRVLMPQPGLATRRGLRSSSEMSLERKPLLSGGGLQQK